MNDADRMFNKSFNDLSFLQSMFNSEYTYSFVFDFDLTLTLKSADGFNYNNNFIELFDNEEKLNKLKHYLKKINQHGNSIYINTRALVKDVKLILKSVGIEVGQGELIKEIKGSDSIDHIEKPFSKTELEIYNLDQIDNVKVLWGVKKVVNLNKICEIEKIPKNNVLFFDDSTININTAKVNGYVNSFLIGSNDSGLIGLDFLLIKLEQILDILYL
jgi:hypothetical protein